MNETQKRAFAKLDGQIIDKHKILELASYATKAAMLDGPLSVLAISNRMDLWKFIKLRCGYLEDQEKRALFYWLCQEPDRIKEER